MFSCHITEVDSLWSHDR